MNHGLLAIYAMPIIAEEWDRLERDSVPTSDPVVAAKLLDAK